MQDEVNERVVTLVINGSKQGFRVTGSVLKKAITALLEAEKKRSESVKADMEAAKFEGKQSMKNLMKHKADLSNIEITDRNIGSFEKIARKYNIDYALKKDKLSEKPRYLVFFKARDADVMTAAFQEYAKRTALRKEKPSVRQKLYLYQQKIQKRQREKVKERTRQRGQER